MHGLVEGNAPHTTDVVSLVGILLLLLLRIVVLVVVVVVVMLVKS